MLKGKRILVTGGTGSFGHHIVRRLIDFARIISNWFLNIEFDLIHELKNIYKRKNH